ncbi:MAG: MATE family efflux transporter, partial [Lachnospiraceae bacterium]|nr:MATE family efflux transporter [Lachnospiraceae bacterium]
MNKKYSIDMCSGNIIGKMLIFALPLMLSSILQLLFNAADVIVVGRFAGDNSLAAVGSTTSLVNMLTNVFLGLSVGANVMVARYTGAGRENDASKAVHTAVTLAILSGAVLTVIGGLGARQILSWMKSPDEVIGLSALYLRIFFLGMIP